MSCGGRRRNDRGGAVVRPGCARRGHGAGAGEGDFVQPGCVIAVDRPVRARVARCCRRERDGLGERSPGAIVLPSASVVVAANAPPLGGLDFVIVTGVPPVFVTVKDFVAVLPTATAPYSLVSLAICSAPGVSGACRTAPTEALPPVVSSPISPLKLPAAVGSKETLTVTAPPAGIVLPTAGTPVGAERRGRQVDRVDRERRAADVAERRRARRGGRRRSCRRRTEPAGGSSSCAAAAWPVPDSAKEAVPCVVSAVSVPPIRPVCVGVNVIGTSIVWPAESVRRQRERRACRR